MELKLPETIVSLPLFHMSSQLIFSIMHNSQHRMPSFKKKPLKPIFFLLKH